MHLDDFMKTFLDNKKNCNNYSLSSEVARYMRYITEKPFFVSPIINRLETDSKEVKPSKILLFSAPGATGKSTLAKYISYTTNSIYWDLSKDKIGDHYFIGAVSDAIGSDNYSQFITDLGMARVNLVIDAFDEAEIISGRRMIASFINDISKSLMKNECNSIICLARTSTAQFIASYCREHGISITHFEIGLFDRPTAKDFVCAKIKSLRDTLTSPMKECVDLYLDKINEVVSSDDGLNFTGYAPVLETIATHIVHEKNTQKFINRLSKKSEHASIVVQIMEELLDREQEKVITAFKTKNEALNSEFKNWNDLYSKEEQISRILNMNFFGHSKYDDYSLGEILPTKLIDSYQEVLDSFLPQHPFLHASTDGKYIFAGPAFRDYLLAKAPFINGASEMAEMYFEEMNEQDYAPSPIFFDCYWNLCEDRNLQLEHMDLLYSSFAAKAFAKELTTLKLDELDEGILAEFSVSENVYKKWVNDGNKTLAMKNLLNAEINTPSLSIEIGRNSSETRISNSSIICNKIVWKSDCVSIEMDDGVPSMLVSNESFNGSPKFDILNSGELKISSPNVKQYHNLAKFAFDYKNCKDEEDMIVFIHRLRHILVEFRTHKKDALGKDAGRIDNVVVGSSTEKRVVLDYLINRGIVYTRHSRDDLYIINEDILKDKGINFSGLLSFDTNQFEDLFKDFVNYKSRYHLEQRS